MIRVATLILAVLAFANSALAQDLQLPTTSQLRLEDVQDTGRYELPIGPWTSSAFPRESVEGTVSRQVWQVRPFGGTTAQLIAPLRAQLEGAGFEVVFTCTARDCGGFDFRFATDIAPEPAMHVNLGDFTYLAARQESVAGDTNLSLVVSRGGGNGFIHLVRISPEGATIPDVTLSSRAPDQVTAGTPGDLIATLLETGSASLEGLEFETGASSLSQTDYASLGVLAAFLTNNPDRRIVLVGHTDAEGSLDGNIALSRARAAAVRDHLITERGVPPMQVVAEGVGFLSPRAPNRTDTGRELNRRVEVVLTAIE